MKTLVNPTSNKDHVLKNPAISHASFLDLNVYTKQSRAQKHPIVPKIPLKLNINADNLLTSKALYQMSHGLIPDLWATCIDLYLALSKNEGSQSALQFLPVMNQITSLKTSEVTNFIKNPETNHILIQNELLKVVLIHWSPGKYSSIHGHPKGGCLFKVLHGSLEEKRYTTDSLHTLLATSTYHKEGIGYIDDQLAYHAVGNPFDSHAISLHAYTPGY